MKTTKSAMLARTAAAIAVSGLVLSPMLAHAYDAGTGRPHYPITYTAGDPDTADTRAAKSYPLELEFMRHDGTYLPGAYVRIKDAAGFTIFTANTDEPIMLTDLATGKYIIEAERNGHTRYKNISIADGLHETIVFDWNS